MTMLQAHTPVSLEASYAWCKSLAKQTAGNFYFSFLTLPSAQFRDMCVLYAFMRVSDDIGDDEAVPVSQRIEQLSRWRCHLEHALAGEAVEHPCLPALVEVIRRHGIPQEYFFALIDGVRDDLEPGVKAAARFETFAELSDYCYRVAGVVGLCCIHVWGFHDDRAVERAVDCGLAFQLTNILRDLGEDARRGRIYLPREDLETFDYTAGDIAEHCRDERFVKLMRFQIERARSFYRKAEDLFDYLDPPGRSILSAMLRIYGGLLEEIERRNYDVFSRRVRLPAWRKLLISLQSIARHRWFGRTKSIR